MSKGAKALLAAVSVSILWGIGAIGAPGEGKPDKTRRTGKKPTTRVGKPLLPPLKPTTAELPEITPEQEKTLLTALKDSSPDHYYAYLMALRKSDQKLYRRALGYAWRTYEQWRDAPKNVREQVLAEREATIEIGKLVHAIRQEKDPAKQAKLAAKLKQAVARKFDAEVVIREYRLAQFEARIQTLRGELKERIDKRAGLIAELCDFWVQRAKQKPSEPIQTPPSKPAAPGKSGQGAKEK
ncbi:MAG: hypothetical protein AMK72_11690 [Planctomycetes bacterium SM23_25]|nr:MAG: hypothetical protein AMK72_11690 [Planctomycetes bacterium SM23_25]